MEFNVPIFWGKIFKYVIENKDKWILQIKTSTVYRSKNVRMSLSYLFLIEINNMYLLVRGNNIDQYQPIGGVFQYTETFEEIKNTFEIKNAPNSQFYEKKDLRIIVPGKNVPKTIKWFYSKRNRETDVRREFLEELVDNGPLTSSDYDESVTEFVKYQETKLRKSIHFGMNEYNIYEIYKVKLTNSAEQKLLDVINDSNKFILCEADDIIKENVVIDGVAIKIGAHAKYTI